VNQRILELLKQASKLANTDDNKDIDRNFDMIVAEKFAELMVKECLEVANNNRTGMEIKTNTNLTADAIKKHFGVE